MLSRLMDVILSFPFLLFAIALVSVVGPSLDDLVPVIAFFTWARWQGGARPGAVDAGARVRRGGALARRGRRADHVRRHPAEPDRAGHRLHDAAGPGAIVFEATLSFLGLGVVPPTATWGNMLADALGYYSVAWWFVLFPGAALLITTLAFNVLGDSVRDAFDPRGGAALPRR